MDATSAIDRALQRAKIRDDCFGEVRFLDDSEDDMRDPIILSPIEQLPQELVWKIIEYEPDAVFNLKLVSLKLESLRSNKIVSDVTDPQWTRQRICARARDDSTR